MVQLLQLGHGIMMVMDFHMLLVMLEFMGGMDRNGFREVVT